MPQPHARTFEGMASLQEQLCEEGFPSSRERAGLVASILQRSDWYDITVRSGCVITFAFVMHVGPCSLQDLANMGEVVASITQHQDILETEMKWLVSVCNRIGKLAGRLPCAGRSYPQCIFLCAGRLPCAGGLQGRSEAEGFGRCGCSGITHCTGGVSRFADRFGVRNTWPS